MDTSVQNVDIGTLAGRVVKDEGKVVQWVAIWWELLGASGEACDAPRRIELTNEVVLVHGDAWDGIIKQSWHERREMWYRNGTENALSWMYSTFW